MCSSRRCASRPTEIFVACFGIADIEPQRFANGRLRPRSNLDFDAPEPRSAHVRPIADAAARYAARGFNARSFTRSELTPGERT